jgi:GTP-binding protein EngB required for normal cell division
MDTDITSHTAFQRLAEIMARKTIQERRKRALVEALQAMHSAEESMLENAFRYGVKSIIALNKGDKISSEEMEMVLSAFLSLYVQAKVNFFVNDKLSLILGKFFNYAIGEPRD